MWLAFVLGVVHGATVHIEGPSLLVAEVCALLSAERVEVEFVDAPDRATDRFRIEVRLDEWWLVAEGPRLAAEPRPIGPTDDTYAAVRVATLLIINHLQRGPLLAGSAPADEQVQAVEPDGQPSTVRPWRLEAGGAAIAWTSAGSVQWGMSVAGHRRLLPWLAVGVRGMGAGFGSASVDENIRTEGWLAVGLVEAVGLYRIGAFELEAAIGGGAAYETLKAQVVDLFAGPTRAEQQAQVDVLGRGAAALRWSALPNVQLWLRGGVLVHGARLSARLPVPYDDGRSVVERPVWRPFGAFGVAVDFL